MPRLLLTAVAAALTVAAAAPALAAPGHLGFAIEATTEGIFSPRLTRVAVKRVAPGSAAAKAGLLAGDAVLEVDGRPVAGAPAREMAGRLHLQAGQHVRLKVQHANASVVTLDMTAAP